MKQITTGVLFIIISIAQSIAGNTITLSEAIQRNLVHCNITGNDSSVHYIRPLLLDIQNTSDAAIDISIENGRKFMASDEHTQNLVVTKAELLTLRPKERKRYSVYSMCIQAHNMAPRGEVKYHIGDMADEKMSQLTTLIEKNNYHNIAGQHAMWVLTDDYNLSTICCSDSTTVLNLLNLTSRLSGKKIDFKPDFYSYTPDVPSAPAVPHHVDTVTESEIHAEFSFKIPKPSTVQIAMFNKDNIVVKELLFNPSVTPGFHTFEYKYDATAFKEPYYYFKLIIDGDVKINKKMSMEE